MCEFVTVINSRYKAPIMSKIWSPENKIKTMRQLWINLASLQKDLGVQSITEQSIKELEETRDNINYERIDELETKLRHDIVAHIHAYAELCPNGGKIIHLGATSNFINDNVDSVLMKHSFAVIGEKMDTLVNLLNTKAIHFASVPTIAYTHLQPAQLITIGRRFSMWKQDVIMDFNKVKNISIPFRGIKGTVGTEDTLLKLFDGDVEKCDELNQRLANMYDFPNVVKVCGQTYSRKYDVEYIHTISCICQSIYKIMNDLRLLSSKNEVFEEFSENQVGSSAMPYKKNPITCEKICSLCRYIINQEQSITQTYINQWLERSLDDSAIKRIIFPECLLLVEYILNQTIYVIQNLYFNLDFIKTQVNLHMTNIISEEIIINGVKKGFNRQDIHEKLRNILTSAADITTVYNDETISQLIDINGEIKPLDYIGRSIEHAIGNNK
jgi:adenylosuccinate lyase